MEEERKIDYLRILSMRAEELCRFIWEEQIKNPMLKVDDHLLEVCLNGRTTEDIYQEFRDAETGDPVKRAILQEYFDEMCEGRYSTISRGLGVSTDQVRKAVAGLFAMISLRDSAKVKVYRETDLEAEQLNGEWKICVFPGAEAIQLNHQYMEMASGFQIEEAADYFSAKILRAKQLASDVQQREDTLQELMRLLLSRQTAFALGTGDAVPLPRAAVADMLGVYPSALDLAVNGKYVRVPAGTFPLDAFFGETGEAETGYWREERDLMTEPSEETVPGDSGKGNTPAPEELPESVSEICVMAPSKEMIRTMQEVCRNYGKQADVFNTDLDTAADLAVELEKRGAKVFISRLGTKKRIEEKCHQPVINANLTLADYVQIMEKAARVKGLIAFFSYGIIEEDVRSMCYLMGLKAKFYSFYNYEDAAAMVRKAIRDGAVLGIGGASTSDAASLYGLEHITVENSPLSLLKAIEAAEQMLRIQKEENLKQEELRFRLERYNLALNFTHDAVVAVNREGRIEVMNSVAEQLVGTTLERAQGKRIDEVIPDTRVLPVLESGERRLNNVLRHGKSIWSSNIVPIIVDGSVRGAVTTFQDVRTLQNDEKKARIKLSEKGLVAKYHFSGIVGTSPGIRNAVRLAEKFSRADATVLIHGETGTGKELFAQSIHNGSRRADGPFVAVNCGSLPKDILEAELFGYDEGAFTGASKGGKTGLFEMAHGGTIFLDEIGEMPIETQVKLLRVLQEKEIRRLGSDRVTPVDIRVVAATNRDLKEEILEGRFRQDLYYRLNVLNIGIPPLRERREDILPLGLTILGGFMPVGKREESLMRSILSQMQEYAWPGNVRELVNLTERIYVLLAQGEDRDFIRNMAGEDLWSAEQAGKPGAEVKDPGKEIREDPEKELPEEPGKKLFENRRKELLALLAQNNYEIGRTAAYLGINRSTLWRRMKKYGISRGMMQK